MADPRPLFYVTAVVVAGLVVWVLSVLLRPGPAWKLAPGAPKPGDPLATVDAADVGPEAAAEEASASAAPTDVPADHESPKNS
ncbi:MAG: hypothetical protein JWM74_1579 [Myxococcaceae bacterium]|nr:hypothetical protein [Myxococcaceae bacterium]